VTYLRGSSIGLLKVPEMEDMAIVPNFKNQEVGIAEMNVIVMDPGQPNEL